MRKYKKLHNIYFRDEKVSHKLEFIFYIIYFIVSTLLQMLVNHVWMFTVTLTIIM